MTFWALLIGGFSIGAILAGCVVSATRDSKLIDLNDKRPGS